MSLVYKWQDVAYNLPQDVALVYKWQDVAYNLPQELFIRVLLAVVNQNGGRIARASFNSIYLGSKENLLSLMKQRFPELGLTSNDCTEMSWVQSTLYFYGLPVNGPLENLLNRNQAKFFLKAKSDYVKVPIPTVGIEGILKRLLEQDYPLLIFVPFGGKMDDISESSIPFPHREGNIYQILYLTHWGGLAENEERVSWMRRLYAYMAPYVSKNPRAAYVNYRDVDIGQSTNGTATYLQGKVWGGNYFKNNYDRLVRVKTKVDPANFFRNEQSIPSVANA